jgi:hypothetical protein
MSASIQFPSSPEVQAEQAIMHVLPPRVPTEKETVALAAQLKMKGPIIDEGALYSVRSGGAILHHFHASDSIRWSLLPTRGRAHKAAELDIRDEAKLRSIAEKFLARLRLLDGESSFASVTYGTQEIAGGKSAKSSPAVTSAFVNFSYSFEGLPVVGPGAKAQVEIGGGGAVLSLYRFWRKITRGKAPVRREKRPVLSWEAAQKVFSRDPAFARLDESAKVIVDTARLAYMALPPRDMQGALFPVYEMRGSVSTRHIEKSPFRRYVVAIDYSAEDLKRYVVANRHFGGPCRVL